MSKSDTTFTITIRATSVVIDHGEEAMYLLEPLIDSLTYEDEYVEETKTLGYMYHKENDKLYIHKGVDINYLKRLLVYTKISYDLGCKPKQMSFEYEVVVPPRNDDQIDVIDFISGQGYHSNNIDESQLFLVKSTGFGKAEPYSRKIPTPTPQGYTLMGDLKVGDYVFDRTGRPTKILQIFEQGEKDVYKVTFNDRRTAYCCEDHLWTVKRNNNDWEIVTTNDMINSSDEFSIPLCEPVNYKDKGYFSCCWGPHHAIIDSCHATYVFTTQKKMREFLDAKGFTGSEGSVSGEWETGDEDTLFWSKKVCLPILYAMGYSAYYDEDTKMIHYSKPDSLKITNISSSHKEQCRCIMVDNPEHLYLTEDFIVTHNTFCSGVGICKYGMKALIVMHRNTLRTQWLNSLYNMSGLSDQYVHEIETSEEFEKIAHNKHDFDYDVYLLTHATFRAGIKRIGDLNLIMNIPKNLGIGIKIIDEAHLEFKDTIMMDFCFNIKRNLYITATDGRSQRDENSIFKYVFSNVLYYKPSAMLTTNLPKKWVEYYAVEVNTNCKPNMYKYKVNGGRGMNPASYGKWVIQYDKKKTHFKCCKDIVKEFYNRDQYSKILLFMPLIELCEECAYFLKIQLDKDTDFNYDLDIRTINSKNSPKDNEYAKSADIIVTTVGSCGTGTDIPGITGIISCSPFVSKINAQQIFGRIRYCGKICQYYDIYDSSVPMDVFWHKSRSKKFKEMALSFNTLYWTEE